MYWNPDMKKLEIYSWDLDKLMMSAFNSSDELKKLLSTDAKSKSEHNLPPIYSPKGLLLYKNHFSSRGFWREYRMMTECANHTSAFYHLMQIPKRDGTYRTIYAVDETLKRWQRWLLDFVFCHIEISAFAMAYRKGSSTLSNAFPHMGHEVLVKLDIQDFFGSLTFSCVYGALTRNTSYPPSVITLLTKLVCKDGYLPQGAPTSPTVANICMVEFDSLVGEYCTKHDITYTRYSDDMTFSGKSFDITDLINYVRLQLKGQGLQLNEKKTKVFRKGSRHNVTGIICNYTLRVPKEYRRKIRQEVYYLQKNGIDEHLKRMNNPKFINNGKPAKSFYIENLLGRINYVLSSEPDNPEFISYRKLLKRFRKEVHIDEK